MVTSIPENKFDKIGTCKICKPSKIIKMKNRNTSGLKRHLEKQHVKEFEQVCSLANKKKKTAVFPEADDVPSTSSQDGTLAQQALLTLKRVLTHCKWKGNKTRNIK